MATAKQQKVARELGVTGLVEWGGQIREEFLTALQGSKGMAVYREMQDNSPVVGAILFAVEMLARQAEVTVEPGGDATADEEAAAFVRTNLDDMSMSWDDTLTEILSMLPYGWSYHEVIYKLRNGWNQQPGLGSQYDDGLLGWRKMPIRSQTSLYKWELDRDGGIKGMWQLPPNTGEKVFLPIEKCALFRPKAHKNNPEGRSILRNAYVPYYFAKRLNGIEAIGVERELAGYPVLYVPAEHCENGSAQLSAWKRAITRIRRDEQEGMVLPSTRDEHGNLLFELVLTASGGERQVKTHEVIVRHETRMAQSMLADFIQIGHTDVGAKAVAEPKQGLFLVAINAVMESIASVFNRHLIPRLVGLNGFAVDLPPRLSFSNLEKDNLLELADTIAKLSGAGMPIFPNAQTENVLLGMLGLPQMSDEEVQGREQEIEDQATREQEMADMADGREDETALRQAELNRARAERERRMAQRSEDT